MEVVSAESYGIPVWGPSQQTKHLIASGTHASCVNNNPDALSLLRISKYDIGSPNGLLSQGVTQSPARFSSLDWIDYNDPFGIIAGGMEDGVITLWDPKVILEGDCTMANLKRGKGCVSATKIHNDVSVSSIEFNPHKMNLLASGGAEVLIQDLSGNLK